MYAVLFMSDTLDVGLEDCSIHLFEDEVSATEFIFEKLVSAALISVKDGREIFVDNERFSNMDDAIEAVQDTFASTEFFHVYKAGRVFEAKVKEVTDEAQYLPFEAET